MSIEDNKLYPTGSCFDDTVEIINALASEGRYSPQEIDRQIWMCHGICTFSNGAPYAHSWIEYKHEDIVWNMCLVDGEKIVVAFTKKEFDKVFRVKEVTRYTITQTCKNMQKLGFPPWKRRYRELTRDGAKKANRVEVAAEVLKVKERV